LGLLHSQNFQYADRGRGRGGRGGNRGGYSREAAITTEVVEIKATTKVEVVTKEAIAKTMAGVAIAIKATTKVTQITTTTMKRVALSITTKEKVEEDQEVDIIRSLTMTEEDTIEEAEAKTTIRKMRVTSDLLE